MHILAESSDRCNPLLERGGAADAGAGGPQLGGPPFQGSSIERPSLLGILQDYEPPPP